MIVVKIELHSAVTGDVEILSSMVISNDGKGTKTLANYDVAQYRKGVDPSDPQSGWRDKKPVRKAKVRKHPRKSMPVLTLIEKSLRSLGYG